MINKAHYENKNATRYMVVSSCESWQKEFDSIDKAIRYATENLDYKSEINSDGYIVNKSERDCESALTIYNDFDNRDVFYVQ